MPKKLMALSWYGGKYIHLNWLLPLLPECHTFVELFGGGGSVLLNRKQSPVEVYNDLDKDVVHFFKVLRDNGAELANKIELTPYSRAEFEYALTNRYNQDLDDIERARLFFVRIMQCRNSKGQTATKGSWRNSIKISRRFMAQTTSAWLNIPENLLRCVHRLLRVQIECKPAIDLLRRYDTEDTLFYCDPPYLHSTRVSKAMYSNEMSKQDHIDFLNACLQCEGKVAISGYASELYNQYLKDWNTNKKYTHSTASEKRAKRTEVLWTNY